MGIIGLKLSECKFSAACAKVLRKYRDISISEIKNIIMNNDYLMYCDYIDAAGIKVILELYYDFSKEDILSVIYEHDTITSVDFLNNLLKSYEETVHQVELDMHNEALANRDT